MRFYTEGDLYRKGEIIERGEKKLLLRHITHLTPLSVSPFLTNASTSTQKGLAHKHSFLATTRTLDTVKRTGKKSLPLLTSPWCSCVFQRNTKKLDVLGDE